MCLAIPSRITHIEDQIATIDVAGVQRQASLLLLEDARIGLAIQKLDADAAQETLMLLRKAAERAERDDEFD